MRIGFDAKRAFINNTGLGNYARSLLKGLYEYGADENKFHLYTPKLRKSKFYQSLRSSGKFSIHTPDGFLNTNFHSYWRSFGMANDIKSNHLDIYHGLSNELPFNIKSTKIPSIVTIHDLIFLRFPNLYPFIDRKIYGFKFKDACEKATKIIAVSECTKDDIVNFYNINPSKIEVHYQSCNKIFFEPLCDSIKESIKQKYGLPQNFLLYVGTIEERKNLLTVIKALRNIKDAMLIVIGRETNYIKKINEYIQKHKLNTKIMFLGSVDNDELPYFYSLASVFIYPSVFEGFGIPVTEALLSNTPVITSNLSSLPEAAGPNSILINPYDYEEMSHRVNELLTDTTLRNKITEAGLQHVQQFHPKNTSHKLMELYNTLAK